MIKAKSKEIVPVLELRRVLYEIKDLRPDVRIRFRFLGQLWQTHHCRVLRLTEKGVALTDERANRLVFIQDLNNVMQFELDQPFQHYEPHFHYTVDPALIF